MIPAFTYPKLLSRFVVFAVLISLNPLLRPAQAEGVSAATTHPMPTGPRLQVAAPAHDFGSVPQGQIIKHTFEITNVGDTVLDITDVKPSCGCTTAGEWTRSIKPGERGTIPLQMDTGHYTGAITKTITVTSNDRERPKTVLEIKASIWTPVQLSSPVVIFPALTYPGEVISQSITILNQVEGNLQLSEITSDKSAFKPELTEIVPGKEFKLTVTTVPPLQTGTQNARITIKTSNPKMPQLIVQAVATLLPPVQVAPTEIMLPLAKLITPEKRYVVLLNHRGANLELSDVKTNAAGVEVVIKSTADKKQFTIMLTFPAGFQADAPGKRSVTGKTNHPDLPTFEVPIVYTGNR